MCFKCCGSKCILWYWCLVAIIFLGGGFHSYLWFDHINCSYLIVSIPHICSLLRIVSHWKLLDTIVDKKCWQNIWFNMFLTRWNHFMVPTQNLQLENLYSSLCRTNHGKVQQHISFKSMQLNFWIVDLRIRLWSLKKRMSEALSFYFKIIYKESTWYITVNFGEHVP